MVFFVFQVFTSVSISVVQTALAFLAAYLPSNPRLLRVFLDSDNVSTVYIWSTDSQGGGI